MKDVMGILYTSFEQLSLRELTAHRALAALPVAARYRLVDFALSGMVNSGVRNVGVVMQGNYRSLMDHLGTGKEWDLHTRNNGLFLLPPFGSVGTASAYAGVLDALRAQVGYLRRSTQEYVLLSGCRILYNPRFDEMIQMHIREKADVTLLYTPYNPMKFEFSASDEGPAFLNVNESGIVTDVELNPNAASYSNLFMDTVLIKRTLLIHLADQALARGQHDLLKDVLALHIKNRTMRVMAYRYNGFCRFISTVKGFYQTNMELLQPEIQRELFGENPLFTKTRDEAPTHYCPGSTVRNSLIADGCVIEGTVENSILFRGVRVAKGAKVKGCILMQDCDLGANVELENVILDKNVTLLQGKRLIGEKQYPVVVGKNVTL